jgi:Na+-transporting methylmalonyl-CoA/oxaloacetate decarboxylase gamma subunit
MNLRWLKLNPPKKMTFVVAFLVAVLAVVLWVIAKVVTDAPDVAVEGAPIAAIVAWLLLAAGNTIKGF